jgi:hypothetical protein
MDVDEIVQWLSGEVAGSQSSDETTLTKTPSLHQ